ncbi:MAG: acetolactate synthase small subunit [Propionibacteriales bacterium]|nr:acetolactate synthase small subunit [Propionibacteriales bacterium]
MNHTLSVLVEDKPGVLTRVAGLFARRGYNINSLAVGPTEHPAMSRITLVVDVEDHVLEQVTKQLNKLVEVLKIVQLEPDSASRQLLLVKVKAEPANRGQVLDVIQLFQAKAVDITADTITIESAGAPERMAALIKTLEPLGVKEIVQSGVVAIGRGSRSISDRALRTRTEP